MYFTLFYKGVVKSGNSADISNKNDIRVEVHKQLSVLRKFAPLSYKNDIFDKTNCPEFFKTVNGFDFWHLVTSKYDMYVELHFDVLVPYTLKSFGDIDNKLKTIFDALRPPKSIAEIPNDWTPNGDQRPLLCLLEDDELILKVNVETDYLLESSSIDNEKIIVTIHVQVKGNSGERKILDLIL